MLETSSIVSVTNLLQLMELEKITIREHLEFKPGYRVYSISNNLPSEYGGYFFKIFFSKDCGKMIEFHQNIKREILLIFFIFVTSSEKYEPTGEILNFKDFNEMKLMTSFEKKSE